MKGSELKTHVKDAIFDALVEEVTVQSDGVIVKLARPINSCMELKFGRWDDKGCWDDGSLWDALKGVELHKNAGAKEEFSPHMVREAWKAWIVDLVRKEIDKEKDKLLHKLNSTSNNLIVN